MVTKTDRGKSLYLVLSQVTHTLRSWWTNELFHIILSRGTGKVSSGFLTYHSEGYWQNDKHGIIQDMAPLRPQRIDGSLASSHKEENSLCLESHPSQGPCVWGLPHLSQKCTIFTCSRCFLHCCYSLHNALSGAKARGRVCYFWRQSACHQCTDL